MREFVTGYLCVLVLVVAPTYSIAETVFAADYHVVLTIDDSQYQARSRTQVKDGHIIPVEFQCHRVDLEVSSLEGDRFQIIVTIFERSNGRWVQMDVDPGGFGGRIGSHHAYVWNGDGIYWNSAGIRLNMAITVSNVRS